MHPHTSHVFMPRDGALPLHSPTSDLIGLDCAPSDPTPFDHACTHAVDRLHFNRLSINSYPHTTTTDVTSRSLARAGGLSGGRFFHLSTLVLSFLCTCWPLQDLVSSDQSSCRVLLQTSCSSCHVQLCVYVTAAVCHVMKCGFPCLSGSRLKILLDFE